MSEPELATRAPENDALSTDNASTTQEQSNTDGPSSKDSNSPKGELVTLNGVDAYICKPRDYPYVPSKLLLFLPSGSGVESANNRLQADAYASNGFLVVMPDLFDHDPAPNTLTDPNLYSENSLTLLEKVKLRTTEAAKSFMIDMWLARHTTEKVMPILKKVLDAIKEEFADAVASGGGIYAVGYCFGGKYVAILASERVDRYFPDDEQRGLERGPWIKAGAIAHPTFVTKEDLLFIKVPMSFTCVDNDPLFPQETLSAVQRSFKSYNIPHEAQIFTDVPHGFAVVGEYDDEIIKRKQGEAFNVMLNWLLEH